MSRSRPYDHVVKLENAGDDDEDGNDGRVTVNGVAGIIVFDNWFICAFLAIFDYHTHISFM